MLSHSNVHLTRPSLNMGENGLTYLIPDDTFGLQDYGNLQPNSLDLGPISHTQEDLLHDIRADAAPSRWGIDPPSFGEFEPTQGFQSAWGSAGAALLPPPFGATGLSETFGAGTTGYAQMNDTAGTPFYPATIHLHSPVVVPPHPLIPFGLVPPTAAATQAYGGAHQLSSSPYPPPPMIPQNSLVATPYGFAPVPIPTQAAMTASPLSFIPNTVPDNANGHNNISDSMNLNQVPFYPSHPLSFENGNGNGGGGGGGCPTLQTPGSPTGQRVGSVSSDDSGLGLQVVPEAQDQPIRSIIQTNINNNQGDITRNDALPQSPPPPTTGVLFVPYNGGFLAVRRPIGIAAPFGTSSVPSIPSQQQQQQQQHYAYNNNNSNYSTKNHVSARAASLARYRQKKAVRSYSKNIRYHMRKVNADRRPRVKGRFIKSSAAAEVAEALNNEIDAGESS